MKDRYWIFITAAALTLTGVIMVFSATGVYAADTFKNSFFFLTKEMMWLCIGSVFFLAGNKVDLQKLKQLAPFLYGATLLLVLLTYTPLGAKIGGAKRWLRVGGINLQPSEFMKYALLLMQATWFSKQKNKRERTLTDFLIPFLLVIIGILPVLGQPDFGTTVMIFTVSVIVMYVSGFKNRYIIGLGFILTPAVYFCIVNYSYRMRRIVAFLEPWKDPQGKGFQIVQSFLAIGRGQMTGVGLGESTQKLFYLPAAHTDFIFSILAEELGFVGSVSVITGFIIIAVLAMKIALKCKEVFSVLVVTGCASYISLQALFNVAVVTGSVPTKGIPLPFISFGGSNLAMNLLAIGLIMNVSRYEESLSKEKIGKRVKNNKRARQFSRERINFKRAVVI